MRKGSIGDTIAWPFLLPGTLACQALGSSAHSDLVRMPVNSLVRTVLGVVVVWIAA